MTVLRSVNLRIFLPVLLLMLFTLLSGVIVVSEYRSQKNLLEQEAENFIRYELTRLQRLIESEIEFGDTEDFGRFTSDLGVIPEVKALMGVDAKGKVLFALRNAWQGQMASDVMKEFDPRYLAQPSRSRRLSFNFIDSTGERTTIAAYLPLKMPLQPGEVRSTRSGALFLLYDLGQGKRRLFWKVVNSGAILWLSNFTVMLVLILALRTLVSKPAKALQIAARGLAQGDYSVHIECRGRGEFAQLAQTFNLMVRRLESNHASLLKQRNLYSLLSAANEMILRLDTPDRLFQEICQIAVRYEGIVLAWVGKVSANGKAIEIVASGGEGTKWMEELSLRLRLGSNEGGPLEEVVRSHKGWVVDDIEQAEATLFGQEKALASGIRAAALIPILRIGSDELEGVFTLYADRAGFFTPDIVSLLNDMATDIAFALLTHENQRKRRQSEENLREREENLAITLHSIGDGVIATDRQGQVLRMNPVAEALTGWSFAEACGRPLEEVFRIINTIDRHPIESPVAKVLREGKIEGLANHTSLISRHGEERQIADSAAPIRDRRGDLIGVILVFHDVTEAYRLHDNLRRSEMLLKHHIDNTPLAAIVWDRQGKVVQWNGAAERMFGYTAQQAIGRHAEALILRASAPRAGAFPGVETLLLQSDLGQVSEAFTRTGRTLYCEWHHTPLLDESGKLLGVASLAQDVTEQQLMTRLLQNIAQEAGTSSGQAFFQALAGQLASGLQVELVFVGELVDQGTQLSTLAVNWRGQVSENFRLVLDGSPAREVMQESKCLISRQVCQHYPNDTLLSKVGAESYVGTVFHDAAGKPIGLLAMIDRKPLQYAETFASLFSIAAVRCGAEWRRMQTEKELRLAAIAFETHEAILITDRQGNIIRVNRAFTEITGYSAAEAIGRNPSFLGSGLHGRDYFEDFWSDLLSQGAWQGELWNRRKNGEVYPQLQSVTAVKDERGELTHFVAVFMDISEQKKAEEEIQRLAFYDTLTGLPNRRMLMDRLRQELAAASRQDTHGALLFLDLDHFKTINDALGHSVGDMLLQQVAKRLSSMLRTEDTVARLGGDEFVVLLPELDKNPETAANLARGVAEKLRGALCEGYDLQGREYHASGSLGITLFPQSGNDPEQLLKQADTAMYRAKAAGRNEIRYYLPEMQAAADTRLTLQKDLRRALSGQQFMLNFQPQFNARRELIGAEVLVRWQHPQRGVVSPAEFIPVAEETGLIVELGNWVLREACRVFTQWLLAYSVASGVKISVNVSPRQFHQPDFVERVLNILRETGMDSARLMLELTEGIVVEHIADTIEKMRALKARGLHFSIDDFGTGYSSLTYLKQLPIDELKIDRSFVQDMCEDSNDRIIVETIIGMAHHMGLAVIAEGVETQAQQKLLEERGCGAYQGYYFSRPLDEAAFAQLLRDQG